MYYKYDTDGMYIGNSSEYSENSITLSPPLHPGFFKVDTTNNTWSTLYGVNSDGKIESDLSKVTFIPKEVIPSFDFVWSFNSNKWIHITEHNKNEISGVDLLFKPIEYTWRDGIKARDSYGIFGGSEILESNELAMSSIESDELGRATLFGIDTERMVLTYYIFKMTPTEIAKTRLLLSDNKLTNHSFKDLIGKKINLIDGTINTKYLVNNITPSPEIVLPEHAILGEDCIMVNEQGIRDNSTREVYFTFDKVENEQQLLGNWCSTNSIKFSNDPFDDIYTNDNYRRVYGVILSDDQTKVLSFSQYVKSKVAYDYDSIDSMIRTMSADEKTIVSQAKSKVDMTFAKIMK